jgi:hypothetical protein
MPPSQFSPVHDCRARLQVRPRTPPLRLGSMRRGDPRDRHQASVLIDDTLPQCSHLVGQGPPIDAIAADQATYNAMIASPPGGMGYPAWRVQYFQAAGIVPAASTRMPSWYFEERNIDGTAVVKRP